MSAGDESPARRLTIRKYTVLLLSIFLGASALAAEVPRVLIIQRMDKALENYDPNVKIASIMASEMDDEGRLESVVWSLTDPVFRAAVEDNVIVNPPDVPNLDYAVSVLGKFKAEYVLFVRAITNQEGLEVEAELYRGRRQIWKDKNKVVVGGSIEFSMENALHSAARTWALKMSGGPLKDLPANPRQGTPDPENVHMQNNSNVTVPPPINRTVDNTELRANVNQMLSVGRVSGAVNLLRDAVDAEPLDPERRLMLVGSLMQIGEPALAAAEARRGAVLFPEQVKFRVLAARGWLEVGNLDEATLDINEAVARDANAPEIRLLMGEISLKGLRYGSAIEHFDAAIQANPSAEAYYKRALAKAMMGNLAGCQADMDQATKLDATPTETTVRERYAFVVTMVNSMMVQTDLDIRSLFQRTRLNPKDQNLPVDCVILLNRTDAITQVLSKLTIPKAHTNSNDLRLLALKLLAQCLSDVKGSFGTLNDEIVTDATINLGEALKSYEKAQETYSNERQTGEPT
ncbi:MAG: hypothetical protein KF784_01495 [Fimbriimonadaceae bacterium]|nr:hypothetical protein [Fimbriimonadaceae bacterium]